jgi:hypothetical protein
MNIYSRKQKLKLGLFIIAVIIGLGIILYSGNLVSKLAEQERGRIEIWAESIKELSEIDLDLQVSPTINKILVDNKTIPVMLLDNEETIIDFRNISERYSKDSVFSLS